MKPIVIVGGGLAGLTLGILLRRSGVPVTIFEAGDYPRHRVCGEFVSGRGVKLLQALGVNEGIMAGTAALFSGARAAGRHRLPEAALCLSRFVLDADLAHRFRSLGGDLRANERCNAENTEGMVCANGRRPRPVENGWRWFGLKAHARGVALDADLEMHVSQNSYVGLCRLPGGEVNVCGLFRRKPGESTCGDHKGLLRGDCGSRLSARLEHASFDERSFCAVAGLSLRPQAIDERECRIGDALTMIPPITGNGMSMALESAQLAAGPLFDYARARTSWERTKTEIAWALRCAFEQRLRWAACLQRMIFSRACVTALPFLFRAEPVWRASFAVTR